MEDFDRYMERWPIQVDGSVAGTVAQIASFSVVFVQTG